MSNTFSQIQKLVPDTILEKLQAVADADTDLCWQIGDTVNELYDYVVANNIPATKVDVCEFAAWYMQSDRSPNTIREYARISAKFPPIIRQQFYFLRFAHFRTAAMFDGKEIDALTWAADYLSEHGVLPSTQKIKDAFFGNERQPQEHSNLAEAEVSAATTTAPNEYSAVSGLSVVQSVEPLEVFSPLSMPSGGGEHTFLLYVVGLLEQAIPRLRNRYPRIASLLAQAAAIARQEVENDVFAGAV